MQDTASLDQDLNEMVLNGQALEAFEKYYSEDVVMQENSAEPVVGKEVFSFHKTWDVFAIPSATILGRIW